MGCLSFHPRKIVTTGEGGAVTTSDARLADRIRRFRHHGIVTSGEYDIPEPGLNYRLPDLLCAIGIPRWNASRSCSPRVSAWPAGTPSASRTLCSPRVPQTASHGGPAYVVQLDRRGEALTALRAEGIEVQIGTYALHHLGAYRDQGPFPGADRAFERALALPFATSMTEAECDRVAQALTRFV